MGNFNTEALFGGILALVVLGIIFFSLADRAIGPSAGREEPVRVVANNTTPKVSTSASGQDLVCQCYDQAFELAGKVKVLSPEYRTGFEQCRARGGVDGGDAWTAGWNARLSGRPYEASCRAYKRRSS
jgi:hypothetical protein